MLAVFRKLGVAFEWVDAWSERTAQDRYFYVKLAILALLIRLFWTLLHLKVNLISDMFGYHESAISLLESGEIRVKGRISASRPPLYSIFLYLNYYIFGAGNLLAVRIIQGVLGSATAVITAKIANKIFSNKAALWAGILYAFYPAEIGFNDLILSETLFTFLLISSLYFLVDVPEGGVKPTFCAGILLGLATLTRTVLFQFPTFLLLTSILFKKRFRSLPYYVILIASLWFILIPWMARNNRVFDRPLLSTKAGVDFYLYNHNSLKLIMLNYCDMNVFKDVNPWELSEVERDDMCKEAAIEWIKANPVLFLIKGIRMQWSFFGVEREYIWTLMAGYWDSLPKWLLALLFLIFAPTIYLLMPLFISGLIYSWNRYPKARNLYLLIAYFLTVTFVYYGFTRHRSPLNPIMMIFAGYAITSWREWLPELKLRGLFQRKRAVLFYSVLLFFIIGWLLEIAVDAGSLFNLGFTHDFWQNI